MSYILNKQLNNLQDDVDAIRIGGDALAAGLDTKIDNETTRATTAENANTTAIASLNSRVVTNYGFKITCSTSVPQIISNGDTLNFNTLNTSSRGFCIPDVNHFDLINNQYTVQEAGYYSFTYRVYIVTSTLVRFSIIVTPSDGSSDITLGTSGGDSVASETLTAIALCDVGDTIRVQCVNGSVSANIGNPYGYFMGWRVSN